jgi:hypothetical protein
MVDPDNVRPTDLKFLLLDNSFYFRLRGGGGGGGPSCVSCGKKVNGTPKIFTYSASNSPFSLSNSYHLSMLCLREYGNDIFFYLWVQLINLLLDLKGLGQRRDDAAVVLDIVCG